MKSEWRQHTIGELCDTGLAELQTGPFGTQLHAHDYVDDGVSVVPTEAIRNRQIDSNVLPKISLTKARELARHRLRQGDILFARRGVQATGHIAYVRAAEDGFICGTGAIRLRLFEQTGKVSADFISHVLANPSSVEWFKFHAIGATMPNLNEGIIRSFSFALPPLEDQRIIAAFLSALDDKIELTRRMNETLEAMTGAIFKDWFVGCGPTRAKVERRVPYLKPEIWALFPDRLDDEEKPAGWEVRPLAALANLVRDPITPASLAGVLFDHYSIPAFDDGQTPVREVGGGILSNKTLMPSDAVLLSKLNPEIPRVWLVDTDSIIRSICSTEFLVFSPQVPADRGFLYSLMTEASLRQRLEAMVTGTSKSHQRVSPQSVLALRVLVAPRLIMDAFREAVTPMLDRVSANRRESRTLAATRDLLIPKLMSGEIRVKEAERKVQAVA